MELEPSRVRRTAWSRRSPFSTVVPLARQRSGRDHSMCLRGELKSCHPAGVWWHYFENSASAILGQAQGAAFADVPSPLKTPLGGEPGTSETSSGLGEAQGPMRMTTAFGVRVRGLGPKRRCGLSRRPYGWHVGVCSASAWWMTALRSSSVVSMRIIDWAMSTTVSPSCGSTQK